MNDINTTSEVQKDFEEMTLAQIVAQNYKAASVFEMYNMDFCCKGNKNFKEACEDKKLDAGSILEKIHSLDEGTGVGNLRPNNWEPDFLVDYIINNHHQYIRESIPVIAAHAEKVVSAHGNNHPELIEVQKIFTTIYKDLKQHLLKEEEILFPYIKYIVNVSRGTIKYEKPYFGKVENPIRMMIAEHESAGEDLYEIRMLTDNYKIPDDACNTFSVFYKELKEFEEDLHVHIHLENNILFPKSIKLEETLAD